MIMTYRTCRLAIASLWLICALAFSVHHLATSSAISAHPDGFAAGRQVKEVEGYKSWTKVNSVPQLMPARVAAACAVRQASIGIEAMGADNPHRDKYFTVYVNEAGRKAMLAQKNPKFPEGSVIVKEKLSAVDSQTPELLTVMIKRHKGFNPASGDWEYMVLDGTGTKVEGRGNLQNCQTCHLSNQKTDYIFRTYLSDEVGRKLK
jgi:hypothetical protein